MDKKYYIVDKSTGEVVGESDSKNEPRRPFLCFLSWVVFYLCTLVVRLVSFQYLRLVSYIHGVIYDFSRIVYFIIIFGGGCIGLGLLITILVAGARLSMSLSEKVRKSARGTRYLVFGILIGVEYLFSLGSMIFGIAADTSSIQYVWHIIVILFFAGIAIAGKNAKRQSDG